MPALPADRELTGELARRAREAGADLIGFADVAGLADLPRAVVVAIGHSRAVLADPEDMPNPAYSQEYEDLNARLTDIATEIAELLRAAGHRAVVNPATLTWREIDTERLAAAFPHKTAATRAGLGWIGKSALLVTPELGPALRLASVLTDAPLAAGDPIQESLCGDCVVCVEACPAGAIRGDEWYPGRPREELARCGVRYILDYAGVCGSVPDGVRCEGLDAVLALQSMSYYLARASADEGEGKGAG